VIFKVVTTLMNGHSDHVPRATQTQLCHWSGRIPTHYHLLLWTDRGQHSIVNIWSSASDFWRISVYITGILLQMETLKWSTQQNITEIWCSSPSTFYSQYICPIYTSKSNNCHSYSLIITIMHWYMCYQKAL